ncbi:MAG: dTMP kinase [Gammaproteobacteria bacterium]|nr:dTMP kinase [Gammaproteobacteria bacterium]
MKQGKFITIEGSEGAGKTTQINNIKDFLDKQDIEVITTREPGGTLISEKIREILLDNNNTELCTDAEMLLVFAARSQHLHELILPAIEQGKWVISDRFTDSSFAYQGYARGLSLERIKVLKQWVQGDYNPDLTLLFDLPVEVGMARAKKRGPSDRFEQEKLDFFERVRQGFLSMSYLESDRYEVIDAQQTELQVSEQVLKIIKRFLK